MKLAIAVLLILITTISAQTYYSGTVKLRGLYTVEKSDDLPLPFRAIELNLGYQNGDFELNTKSALEYNWSTNKTDTFLRECYLSWYPDFGEISLGKQLQTWGMADSNNPTDNINPYDFNYLFETGIERKRGTFVGKFKYYGDSFDLEALWLPDHEPHRLVKDPSFPIRPDYPPAAVFNKPESNSEFGLRFQSMILEWDYSISYFSGHDRLLTPEVITTNHVPSQYNYRETDVIGFDLVGLMGNFIVRNEIGYFTTATRDKNDVELSNPAEVVIEMESTYLEYTAQLEYTGFDDVTVIAQLIGLEIDEIGSNILSVKSSFVPGLGMPFAQLSDRMAMASIQKTFYDPDLELKLNLTQNLVNEGSMIGFNVKYSPADNWNFELNLVKFSGDSQKPDDYIFNKLEEFSNFSFGLEYSF